MKPLIPLCRSLGFLLAHKRPATIRFGLLNKMVRRFAESDQAAPSAQPEKPKAAHKKHNKKHAAKRAKAKTETENPDTEKKEGDTKQ
jgi:hypothetical protein